MEIKESKKLIGNISLILGSTKHKAEIGYWIGEEFWNKGYCTEAMKAVVKYAFTARSINKITSRHMAMNPASGKVMVKSGLVQEGYLKQDVCKNGHYVDSLVYGLVKSDWKAMALRRGQ